MKPLTAGLAFLLSAFLIAGCDSNSADDGGDGADQQAAARYVITASPTAVDDVADYLLVTDSLTSGSVSTLDNGIEQDGTYRYYITNNNKFYSLLYGQGNPGAVTAYELNAEGELTQLVDFQSETVQAFTNVDDEILMMQIPRGGEPIANWYRLSTETSQRVDEGQLNTQDIIDNDEWAFFSWMTQVDDQVYAPFFSIKACCNDRFGTEYPGTAWVAVFSYPEMELQQIIEDDRTSHIGRYFTKGLSVDENGDVYAFSSATAQTNGEFTSPHPSAITRINDGETAFDESYFFDINEASGGYYLTDHVYASNGNVLLMMQDVDNKSPYDTGRRLAVANVYDQSFTWVDGMPDVEDITSVSSGGNAVGHVSEDGGTVYVGISTEESSHVYAVDMETATATQGLQVKGGVITSIERLELPE